ncbi:MAG: transketolase family protein [Calditrichaeota bacterium]|nr:MAG: transketolase family protein [Calditrichota bacterium]
MPEMKKTREGWGKGLVALGDENPNVVVLTADLNGSTMCNFFAEKYPERFVQVGIAEQNMMCVAAGLSLTGKVPFLATYGAFASTRSLDQIRITVAYSNLNVKIGGAHGGISVGPDGATHQAMEEFAIIRSIPNMTVICPSDIHETRKATIAAGNTFGPFYLRFGRENVPVVTNEDTPFQIGKAIEMASGSDLTIIACGMMVYEALVAAEELGKNGISARVLNMHTIKPIDREAIIKACEETGAIVTAEEHQIHGGLGGAVSEVVVQNSPVPMELVAVKDRFGKSGKPSELMKAFGLTSKEIIEASQKVLKRKK